MPFSTLSPRVRNALFWLGWVALTFCAPLFSIGSMPDDWYARLHKPPFHPPSWIFGPVWTLLYLLMATAAWLVWKSPKSPVRTRALATYFLQLILNAAWTPVFFRFHQIGWALLVVIALWNAIALCIGLFRQSRPLAAGLMAPYLAWVTFATILNFTLWQLNGSSPR